MKNQTLRKTIAGLVLGGALLAVPVLADTYTDGSWTTGDEKTTVNYSVGSTYTVVIPSGLTVDTAGTYKGDANNVFFRTDSLIGATTKYKVTLPVQTFTATDATGVSTIPFSVQYTPRIDKTAGGTVTTKSVTGTEETLLQVSGADIAGELTEDATNAVVGKDNISATVKATVLSADLSSAQLSGAHTGYITFEVKPA